MKAYIVSSWYLENKPEHYNSSIYLEYSKAKEFLRKEFEFRLEQEGISQKHIKMCLCDFDKNFPIGDDTLGKDVYIFDNKWLFSIQHTEFEYKKETTWMDRINESRKRMEERDAVRRKKETDIMFDKLMKELKNKETKK